jgi:DNA polymerase III alpha subunit
MNQKKYANLLKTLLQASTYKQFQSMRQKMQWLGHTRPDIACSTAKLSQVTESIFNKERQDCVKQLKKTV